MATPKVTYPSGAGFTFGQRVNEIVAQKEDVARKVWEEFLDGGKALFLSDGSSTFYVGLEIFERNKNVKIYTNNVAVAHEYSFWATQRLELQQHFQSEVTLARGKVLAELCGTFGDTAKLTIDDWFQKGKFDTVIVSVKSWYNEQGPAGEEQESLEIKQTAVINRSAQIIFVADWSKFTSGYTAKAKLIDRNWNKSSAQMNFKVVTTRHPDVTAADTVTYLGSPKTEKEWYVFNTRSLRLSRKLIEIPPVD